MTGETGGSRGPGLSYSPSSLGVDPDIVALVGYLFPILGFLLFVVESESDYVRFHGLQAALIEVAYTLLGGGVLFVTWVVIIVLPFVLPTETAVTLLSNLAFLSWVLFAAVVLAISAVWLYLAYKAFGGEWYEAPLIGSRVKQYVRDNPVALPT